MARGPSLVLADVAGSRVLSTIAVAPPQLFASPALLATAASVGRDFSRAVVSGFSRTTSPAVVETKEKAIIELRDLQAENLKMVSTSCAAK
jgi:hypothetical protein